MFIANEPVGVFFLPELSRLGVSVWQLMKDLNFIFLPLMFYMVYVAFDSRQQGADEGSAAVLGYKRVEKAAWWHLCVLMIFLIPTANVPVRSNNYSCFAEERMAEIPKFTDAYSGHYLTSVQVPLGFGLANNLSQSFFGTMRGKMNCANSARLAVDADESRLTVRNSPPLEGRIDLFNTQCMAPAMSKMETLKPMDASGDFNNYSKDAADRMYFFGDTFGSVFMGSHVASGEEPIRLSVDSAQWNSAYSTANVHKKVELAKSPHGYGVLPDEQVITYVADCEQFAGELKSEIEDFVNVHYADEVARAAESLYATPGATMSQTQAQSKAMDRYIQRAYDNSIIQRTGGYVAKNHGTDREFQVFNPYGEGGLSEHEQQQLAAASDRHQGNWVGAVGLFLAKFTQWYAAAMESYAIFAYLAVFLVLIQGVVLVIAPMIVLLSGYSASSILGVCMVYFYLAGLGFVFEVAYVMTSTIRALGDSVYGIGTYTEVMASQTSTLLVIGASFSLWTAVCSAVGLKLGAVVGMIAGAFGMVGTQAYNMVKDAAKFGVTRGRA
ncbi:conjugal transfer protein TraG N-terminal domain-containing protein [Vibrio sp. PNB22_3_1]